jgi:uncharacterized protein
VEFNQENNAMHSIVSIEKDYLQLTNTQLKIPCFLSSNYMIGIEKKSIKDLDRFFLFPHIVKSNIDLLIIGTGIIPQFLSAKQSVEFDKMNIGLECMNTQSACSSFNLLLSDSRKVGLLLL